MPGFRLEEPFSLVKFHNKINKADITNCVIGLDSTVYNEDQDDIDYVSVTVQGEGLKLYNTMDQKCIKSWTTPPGVGCIRPALYVDGGRDFNAIDYTYAIVVSPDITDKGKTVWVWKNKRNNDEEAEKIIKTFPESIHAIHTSSELHSNVIIVDNNGSITLTTKDLDRITAQQKRIKDNKVLWSTVFVTSSVNSRHSFIPSSMVPHSSTIVVTLSHTVADNYNLKLNYVNIERRSIDRISSVDFKLSHPPITFTLDTLEGRLTLLDKSGQWTVYGIHLKHSSSKKINCTLTKHISLPLDGYKLTDPILGTVTAMTSLPNSHIALMATRMPNKKNGNTYEHVISVWDIKYGTLQAEQTLQIEKSFMNKECIYNIASLPNSHLAITVTTIEANKKQMDVHSNVLLCPYSSEPVSLLAAMNKMKSTVEFIGIEDEKTSIKSVGYSHSGYECCPTMDDTCDTYGAWIKTSRDYHHTETNCLSLLLRDTITEAEFVSLFFDFIHIRIVDYPVCMDDMVKQSRDYRQKMKKYRKIKENMAGISEYFLSNVVSLCFKKDVSTVWGVDIILYLLSKHMLRNRYVEKGIIAALLERDGWSLMPIVLERVQDIPENDLVTLIKTLISLCEQEEWKDRFDDYLKMIITTPRNDIFLQQALKRIDASELPIILNTLIRWNQQKQIEASIHTKVVDFTNALLDIHFTTLILEPGLHTIVTSLRDMATTEMEVADDLEQLKNILGAYDRKHQHTRAKKTLIKEQKNEIYETTDELTKFRKKNKGKFGGEQGIPVYRVEVFRF